MIEVLTELGRRMTRGCGEVAACNIACDMLMPGTLAGWLGRYPELPVAMPRNVLIIMAGNIPFVGMHDLICVLAAGHSAIVKPSSKDRGNMEWVVAQLIDIDPRTPVSITAGECAPDAVIAMGSDATVAAIAARYPAVPTLLRGNRSSFALLTGRETPEELEGLVDDILLYSGLGCRSVSLVWVPRGYDFGRLGGVLRRREATLTDTWRGSLRQTRALLRMTGAAHTDAEAALLVENRDFSAQPGVLNYAFYDDPAEVACWAKEHDEDIQCVAATRHSPLLALHSRAVRLGETQRPGLADYPDGRDTMQFLTKI